MKVIPERIMCIEFHICAFFSGTVDSFSAAVATAISITIAVTSCIFIIIVIACCAYREKSNVQVTHREMDTDPSFNNVSGILYTKIN